MKIIDFNNKWLFRRGRSTSWGGDADVSAAVEVNLPHDAMILEERNPESANRSGTGFYPGNFYTYTKSFSVPDAWREKNIFIEFDGVYCNAKVYVNSILAAVRTYGYSQFGLCLNDYLHFGAVNEITVTADTSMEKQSRWYSGGGIYRRVRLYEGGKVYLPLHGVTIKTLHASEKSAALSIGISIQNTGEAEELSLACEILTADGTVAAVAETEIFADRHTVTEVKIPVEVMNPKLWDCDHPILYCARISVSAGGQTLDTWTETFGIRMLELDAVRGLRINGRETKLRGACIHHDNGLIGAISLPDAEERRVHQLKEAGFNSIRSAHNPASPALLEACDRLGMLVMEEAFDMWTRSKCDYDYSNSFFEWWERDIAAMVQKDINHPCVILYSIGNEIDEIGTPAGDVWNRRLAQAVRALDDSRYITNSVNGMIVLMDKLDSIAADIVEKLSDGQSETSGSNLLNNIVSLAAGEAGELLFSNPLIGQRTETVYGDLDIAGMNYMTCRYGSDHETYPERVMLGTESFPGDIVRIWREVKKYAHVIGDFTWTGYDYLGEAGGGVFRYDGSDVFGAGWPSRTAWMGDRDITGLRLPISYMRQIVYGLRKEPYIAVEDPAHYGQTATINPWTLYDDLSSWTWPGFEGKPVIVRVYSPSEEVELFFNGVSLGRKPAGEDQKYVAAFELPYLPGELKAIGYTGNATDGEYMLRTAGNELQLLAEAERRTLPASPDSLAYVRISLVDEAGTLNPAAEKEITVSVSGPAVLQGFGSAAPETEGNYFDTKWKTFRGSVMAVLRSDGNPGEIRLTASCPGLSVVNVSIIAKEDNQ